MEDEQVSVDQAMKKVNSIENEIKFKAFGKTRADKKKQKAKKGLSVDIKTEETRNKELLKNQSKKIEDEILKIKSNKHGKAVNIFKMRDVITGPKKASQAPTAVRGPNSGELVFSWDAIKKVTLAYCVDNLTKKGYETKEQMLEKKAPSDENEGNRRGRV